MFESRLLRDGKVVKFLRFKADTYNQSDTIISVTIDYEKDCIRIIVLSGINVCVERLLYAMLADKDFRSLMIKYQQEVRESAGRLVVQEGRQDIFITNGSQVKTMTKESIIRLCTALDFKENQKNAMWIHISDILRMCCDFNITEVSSTSKRYLTRLARAEYVGQKYVNDFLSN